MLNRLAFGPSSNQPYSSVDVFEELVQVLEPDVGLLIIKVVAHCDDEVVGGVHLCLILDNLDKGVDALVHIIV